MRIIKYLASGIILLVMIFFITNMLNRSDNKERSTIDKVENIIEKINKGEDPQKLLGQIKDVGEEMKKIKTPEIPGIDFDEWVKEEQIFNFYLFIGFSIVLFILQIIFWEKARESWLSLIVFGSILFTYGILTSSLSESSIADALLLKQSKEYAGPGGLNSYISKYTIAPILCGYGVFLNGLITMILRFVFKR